MIFRYNTNIFLLSVCLLSVISGVYAKKKKHALPEKPEIACGSNEEDCKDLQNSCLCHCAYKPGLRDKIKDDAPVFIKNDPEEIYCYCKPRDIEKHYADKIGL